MDNKTPLIEYLFMKFESSLGPDLEKYKNHVYRVYSNCLLLDGNKENEEKYAIAAVFHDIGIWTDHTIDYLAPSIGQAKIYLTDSGKAEITDEITGMIYWHHKLSKYEGQFSQTVGYFRKADWIDVSLGLLRFGADRKKIHGYRIKWPNRGFHFFLLKQICKNFLRHPLNPLPMFKG